MSRLMPAMIESDNLFGLRDAGHARCDCRCLLDRVSRGESTPTYALPSLRRSGRYLIGLTKRLYQLASQRSKHQEISMRHEFSVNVFGIRVTFVWYTSGDKHAQS